MAVFTAEATPLRTKIITGIKFIVFLGLGIFIIWLSLRNLTDSEKTEIIHSFKTANYYWVILAIVLGVFSHLLRTLRWMILLEPMGYRPSVKNTFFAVMIGYFANMAFTRLGEVTRCGILAKYEKIPFNKAFGTVITERALDMVLFIMLFFLMIFTQVSNVHDYLDTHVYPQIYSKFNNPELIRKLIIGGILLFVGFVSLVFLFRKQIGRSKLFYKIKNLVLGFWEGLKSLSQIRKPFLFVVYSFAIWILYYFMLYSCFFCFRETGELGMGAGLSALVLGSVGIMITPGGIGIYPAIISETLILYGSTRTTGLALGWIAWTAQSLMILIVGSQSLILLSFNKNPDGKASESQ